MYMPDEEEEKKEIDSVTDYLSVEEEKIHTDSPMYQ
jgi:hypothetical protein